MARVGMLEDRARSLVAEAVEQVEAGTAVEVVVSLRRQVSTWLALDLLVGFGVALGVLFGLLFLPQPFPLWHFPLDLTLAFAGGAFGFHQLPWVRRRVLPRRVVQPRVTQAARAAFYELGASRTRGRTGLVVFATLLEGKVLLVPDVGVDLAPAAEGLAEVTRRLEAALKANDAEAFSEALQALGPPLAALLPITDDDVDELPNALELA